MNDFIDLPHLPECLLGLPLETIHEIHSHTYHAIKADRQQRVYPDFGKAIEAVKSYGDACRQSNVTVSEQEMRLHGIRAMLEAVPKFGEEK